MGRKFARIAVVDASLIKLSLLAYSWAEYRKQTGGQRRCMPCWSGRVASPNNCSSPLAECTI
jgi:hypothetical protein